MLVHEYATATPKEGHEPARIVSDAFPLFYNAYLQWTQHGFKPRGTYLEGESATPDTTPATRICEMLRKQRLSPAL